MSRKLFGVIALVLLCSTVICTAASVVAAAADNAPDQTNIGSIVSSPGLRSILRMYDECQRSDGGASMCLKKKAVTFIDRISKIDVINIGNGVKVVGGENAIKTPKTLNENDLEQMLPRSLEDRDYFLNNMLTEKLANYISGRKIQISLPQVTGSDLGRGVEEGRGKMKKMMGMMMMGFAMKMAAMVPVAIALLYLLAGSALIVSKIALLLAGIIGIKKLLSSKQGGGAAAGWASSGAGAGWQSSGHGSSGGGWDRRSNEAQNLAYNAYSSKDQ